MKSSLLILCFFVFFLISCVEDSTSPTVDGTYKFAYTFEEITKVYGEGGKEIPQNEWNDECLEQFKNYQESIDVLKVHQIKLDGNNLIMIENNKAKTFGFTMKGDTLIVSYHDNGELHYTTFARQINHKTLEFQYYSFKSKIGDNESSVGEDDAYKLEEEKEKYLSYVPNLEKNDWVGMFSFKVHFKK